MAQAYQLIQAVTVGAGGASTIDFTNIPQTYTDLMVVCSIRYTGTPNQIGDTTWIQFNGSTANQTSRMLAGNGSSASSYTDTKIFGQSPGASATASTFGNTVFYIPNYTGSTNKSVSIDGVTENNATTGYIELVAGLWSNTAAITSITLKEYGGTKTMVQYSTAYLYGVGGVRATGGTITADSKYTYHTFTSSGTFTALEKIKGAEVLCIAGGGGGGSGDNANQGGGGGGGGGVAYVWGQTLNAGTSFSAVIGSGGSGGTFASGNGVNGSSGNNSSFGATTAVGGGAGATVASAGIAGGSGGGAGAGLSQSGGSATQTTPAGGIGYGNAGGDNTGYTGAGGGGGGAGSVGSIAASNKGGRGGDGTSLFSAWGYVTSTGENVSGAYYYSGGGGGAGYGGNNGTKGLGGATAGSSGSVSASNATANTGGGGGGASGTTARSGGTGGSGLVIVRYPN